MNKERMQDQLIHILTERTRLQKLLSSLPMALEIYPTDANFILVKVADADGVYNKLVEKGVIVRNRNNVTLCAGCLRITVGMPKENDTLMDALKNIEA
jgi:histidinol-phosphate aminotransferase